MAAMDVGVVVDPGHADYHYSPLKVREYMACGLPVVVPKSGQLERLLRHEVHALLVPRADERALTEALEQLASDGAMRRRLGARARQLMESEGTWHHQIARVEAALDRLGAGQAA